MAASTHLPRLVAPEEIESPSKGHVRVAADLPDPVPPLELDDVYRDNFAFVWRSARRLGVGDASLDDVVQEVFVVVFRRLATFEGRSALRTWLFGITLRIVRDHKRSVARKTADETVDPDTLRSRLPGPVESMERSEAVQLLYGVLDEMDDERREIFVMADLEQLPMPEVAKTLGINVNTAYARLRAARQAFEGALARHRARDEWKLR